MAIEGTGSSPDRPDTPDTPDTPAPLIENGRPLADDNVGIGGVPSISEVGGIASERFSSEAFKPNGNRGFDDEGNKPEEITIIGGETEGIPISVFSPQPYKWIEHGRSGKPFMFHVTENSVSIQAWRKELDWGEEPPELFAAEVNEGTLKFAVDNYDGEGNRYPDIWPSRLFAKTLEYFAEQRNPVDAIETEWLEPQVGERRDNRTEYDANVAELHKSDSDITDEDRKNAAKQTWTGRLAERFGYTEVAWVKEAKVEHPDETYVDITARFVRPKSPATAVYEASDE